MNNLKIAHFVYYGPHRSGMYETTRDLCLAETKIGCDARIIDTSYIDMKQPLPVTYKFDRGVDIATQEWAEDVDVHVLHSQIPAALVGKAPAVLILHGAPEYCFYSELLNHEKGDRNFSTLLAYKNEKHIKKFITFWKRHLEYWQTILGEDRVLLIEPPVNLEEFKPEGDKLKFNISGKFNIGFCDTWRTTFFKDPFQIIIGVRNFWKKQQNENDVKLQLFAIPSKRDVVWDRYINSVKKENNIFGEIFELHAQMPNVYRALDVVVTTTVDASRIVRESLACGTPIIAPHGNPYTPYTCELNNPESLSNKLEEVRALLKKAPNEIKQECINTANTFTSDKVAKSFIEILKSII